MPLNVGGSVISKEMGDYYSRLSVAGNYVTNGLVLYLDAGISDSYYGYWSPSLSNGANAFDGNLSTAAGILGGTAGPFTYTFTNPPQVTTARMYVTFGATSAQVGSTTDIFLVNGIDVTQKAKTANLYLSAGWIDVTEETEGKWNTFQFKNVSAVTNAGIYAIEINGEILIGNYDGTTWTDLSGNGYNGTLINGPTFSSGNGGSLVFDGVNDNVSFSYNSSVAFLNRSPYTLECFVNAKSSPSYPGWINREGLSPRDGYNLIYTEVGITPGEVFVFTERFTSGTATAVGFTESTSTFFNNWHHVVSTYDGTTLSIYRDAVFQNSATSTGNLTNASTALQVGQRTGNYSKGDIAITRIYGRALSAAEIQQNFNATRNRFGI